MLYENFSKKVYSNNDYNFDQKQFNKYCYITLVILNFLKVNATSSSE